MNLIVIRAAVPRISDRETLSLARLDSDMMLASLPHLIADVKAHPRWFAKDMARCQAKTDADPSLLQGYRPLA